MANLNVEEALAKLRKVRQFRQFTDEPVTEEQIQQLLEVARWSGSSRNTQPWQFIVVTDKVQLKSLSEVRTPINWVARASLAIALVMDGHGEVSEAYDEGRVTERLLIAARTLGLGAGTAWYGEPHQQQAAKDILGIGPELTANSLVAIGNVTTSRDPRGRNTGGRKPLNEIVSYGQLGKRTPGK